MHVTVYMYRETRSGEAVNSQLIVFMPLSASHRGYASLGHNEPEMCCVLLSEKVCEREKTEHRTVDSL